MDIEEEKGEKGEKGEPVLSFPESMVISVSTHGMMDSVFDEQWVRSCKKFFTPDNLTVIKISAATPGEPNFLCPTSIDDYNKIIQDSIRESIQKSIEENGTAQLDITKLDIEKTIKRFQKDVRMRDDILFAFQAHVRPRTIETRDRRYDVSIIHPGEELTQKYYTRTPETRPHWENKWQKIEDLTNPNVDPYDIFEQLDTLDIGNSTKRILLSELLQQLSEKGVKEVVIFDFSCSVGDMSCEHMTPRDWRAFRNSAKGGKYRKKTLKKRRKKTLKKRRKTITHKLK